MTKEELKPEYLKRMLQAFIQRYEMEIGRANHELEIALDKGNSNQAFLIECQTRNNKTYAQIYKLALKQLEDQEKCCANCADWFVEEINGRPRHFCNSPFCRNLEDVCLIPTTSAKFYCSYWRKDV